MTSSTPLGPANADPTIGRRGLLLGTGAALTLTSGCALNNPFSSQDESARTPVEDLAPDVALAVTAVGAILDADTRARLVAESFPALRSRIDVLISLHAGHLEALSDAVPAGSVAPRATASAVTVPASRGAALKQQQRVERALGDRLVGLALRAESGPFARLLGSMSAAISQQLADLDRRDAA